ncbi:hypothetical protein J2X65_000060 [Ancylobacter sp. 3268]|nr:hypothetical protein [Ancylobacter sp. 3268]
MAAFVARIARPILVIGDIAGMLSLAALLAPVAGRLGMLLAALRVFATLAAGFAGAFTVIGKVAGTATMLRVRHIEFSCVSPPS